MIPWCGRGVDYAQRSLAIRTSLGDRRGQGRSLSSLGVALYAASDFRGAIEAFQRATGLLDRTADRREANAAAWHIAMGHYRLGELSRAAELAEQTYWRAMEIGDRAASGVALSAWSATVVSAMRTPTPILVSVDPSESTAVIRNACVSPNATLNPHRTPRSFVPAIWRLI